MAHYAWAPIRYNSKVDKNSGAVLETSTVEVGEEVSAKKLGISNEEFDQLVENEAVRKQKYPKAAKDKNLPPQQIMIEAANAQLLAAEAGTLIEEAEEAEAEAEEEVSGGTSES